MVIGCAEIIFIRGRYLLNQLSPLQSGQLNMSCKFIFSLLVQWIIIFLHIAHVFMNCRPLKKPGIFHVAFSTGEAVVEERQPESSLHEGKCMDFCYELGFLLVASTIRNAASAFSEVDFKIIFGCSFSYDFF